jgi:hypothetical protein
VVRGSGLAGAATSSLRTGAGDRIESTRGFRAGRSADGAGAETDGSTGRGFGVKSASAAWRALVIRSRSSPRGGCCCSRWLSKCCPDCLATRDIDVEFVNFGKSLLHNAGCPFHIKSPVKEDSRKSAFPRADPACAENQVPRSGASSCSETLYIFTVSGAKDLRRMSLSTLELNQLRDACGRLGDGEDYRCDDYVENLLSTVLDFQLPYEPTTKNAIEYFYETRRDHLRTHSDLQAALAQFPNTKAGNMALAMFLWNKHLWTRAKFLRVIVNGFEKRGITDQESLRRWLTASDFHADIEGQFRIDYPKNHSIGYAIYHWLLLRCGFDTIKPDKHIRDFIYASIGRKVPPPEAVAALTTIAAQLHRKPYSLDAAI